MRRSRWSSAMVAPIPGSIILLATGLAAAASSGSSARLSRRRHRVCLAPIASPAAHPAGHLGDALETACDPQAGQRRRGGGALLPSSPRAKESGGGELHLRSQRCGPWHWSSSTRTHTPRTPALEGQNLQLEQAPLCSRSCMLESAYLSRIEQRRTQQSEQKYLFLLLEIIKHCTEYTPR